MNVSVIIPNYNSAKLLERNIPKVSFALEYYLKDRAIKGEIIIVDDASTDASSSVISNLKSQISNLKFIQNDKNIGFSSTVNRGVSHAKGEIIILFNSDVIPEKDSFRFLLQHFEKEDVFAVGAMDKSIEEGKQIFRGRGIGKWKRGFLVHSAGKLDKQTTLWASGGSSAFRKNIWEKLEGLDENFNPFYWEDIDLSYRGWKSGYKVIFENKSIVLHEHEKGAIRTAYTKSDIKTIAYRNQFLFVWKNADTSTLVSHILWLPYHILSAIIRFDMEFFVGFFGALGKTSQLYKKRNQVQKLFIFSDKDIIKEFTQ